MNHKTFDFRTFLFVYIILMLDLIVSSKDNALLMSFMIAYIFVIDTRSYKLMIKLLLGFIGLFVLRCNLDFVYSNLTQSSLVLILNTFVFVIQRIYIFIILSLALRQSKNLGEITTSFCKMHLHRGVILSLLVMIRYFPNVKQDLKTIISSMRLKGIKLSFSYILFHPMKTIEYLIVPLLFKSMRTTEEFTSAALIKGYGFSNERSSYFDVKMRMKDYSMIFVSFIQFCLILYLES